MKLANVKNCFITGVSKGIGFEYAKILLSEGKNVYGVARNCEPLIIWAKEKKLNNFLKTYNFDLSNIEECKKLFENIKEIDFDIMINNAGFGVFGLFNKTNLDEEMNMIDLNIKSLHFFTKEFVKLFENTKNYKKIINVASIAAFSPGPVFAAYYASKAYVLSLSEAVSFELKKAKSKLSISTICPGPLKTEFWTRADYKSKKLPLPAMDLKKFCDKSLNKAINSKKTTILIGLINNLSIKGQKFVSKKYVLNKIYKSQSR